MSYSNVIDRPPIINQPPSSEKPKRPRQYTVFFNQSVSGLAPDLITILCRDFGLSSVDAMHKHREVLKGGNIVIFTSSYEVCESKVVTANRTLFGWFKNKPETAFSSFGFKPLHHPILN